MEVGDVMIAAPDARGAPLWNDFVVGVVVPHASLDDESNVQYEQDAWKPKQGLARVHRTSRKVGCWKLNSSQTDFLVQVETGLEAMVMQLNATSDEVAKIAADLPGRARELLQAAVMTQAKKRRRITIDVDKESTTPSVPPLSAQINQQMQARLCEVKDELGDMQDQFGPTVTQNQVHKEEIEELRKLAVKLGADPAKIEEIKRKYQRKASKGIDAPSRPLQPVVPSLQASTKVSHAVHGSMSTHDPLVLPRLDSSPSISSLPPMPEIVKPSWTEFRKSPIHHINALATDDWWAPHENAGFFPFVLARAATPYFSAFPAFGDSGECLNAIEQGLTSYKQVRDLLRANGFTQGVAVQLATWFTKVCPGTYLVMRHETTLFVSPTVDGVRQKIKPSRGVYVLGRVSSSPAPGSAEAQRIAARVHMQLQRHAQYEGQYAPDSWSEEYEVDWFKLGYLDELKQSCPEFVSYMAGQQTKTLSDRLCSKPDINETHRKVLTSLWNNARLDILHKTGLEKLLLDALEGKL